MFLINIIILSIPSLVLGIHQYPASTQNISCENPINTEMGNGFYLLDKTNTPLHKKPDLNVNDIEKIEKVFHPSWNMQLEIYFTPEWAKKLENITSENTGKLLGIIVNDELILAPVIREVISGEKVHILADFTDQKLQDIICALQK